MPHALTLHDRIPDSGEPPLRPVLVTGAAGRIGSHFARHAPGRYRLRLMVRPGETLESPHEVVEADLGDLARMKAVCEGIDTVLHLAATGSASAPWETLLANNVVGTYHLFAAAKAAGCRRVVFASSIHAVSGYPTDVQVSADAPVNPGDLYGVTKCYGEALARYMAEQEELSAIAVRIGAYMPPEWVRDPQHYSAADAWVSPRDLDALFVRCIDDESIRFAIVNGLSDNGFNRLEIASARERLGYAPQDAFHRENPAFPDLAHLQHHSRRDGYPSGLRNELEP